MVRPGQTLTYAEQWIYETLLAASAVADPVGDRLYGYNAPQEPGQYPAVVWQVQGVPNSVHALGSGLFIMDRPLYLVRAIGIGSTWEVLEPIADAIDAALDGASGSVTTPGGSALVMSCMREAPFAMPETVNGVQYRHLGGQYRLEVQLQ